VDDHPICRRCGFDLFNRPQSSTKCAECGADLARPHAIRDGRRVRRGGMIFAGAAILAIVFTVVGGAVWMSASTTDWREFAPVWYLRREALGVDPAARDAALAQLSKRVSAGKLSQPQIDALADEALKLQADWSKPWGTAWGDWVENASGANKLSSERWKKYLEQAPSLQLEVRPQVRRGDRLPYWIRACNSRVGSRSNFSANYKGLAWEIGPVRTDKESDIGGGTTLNPNGGGGLGSSIDLTKYLDKLGDGPQAVKVDLEIKIMRNWQGPALATRRMGLDAVFNLHPADEPTVKVIHDPSLRAGVEAALSCNQATYGPSWNAKHLGIQIDVGPLPVGVGYDVYALIRGKEVKLGGIACPKKPNTGGFGFGNEVNPPFDDPTVDLILKPSVDAAIGTTDTFEIWDGEVTIKNVKVTRPTPPATTRSATAKN
jgi:hypothetical protein